MKKQIIVRWLIASIISAASVMTAQEPTVLAVKSGNTIAFLGDSITQAGAKKGGYVSLTMDALKQNGIDAALIPAGVSGNRSTDMLARLDKDLISKSPQWMVLNCGVNDVWHFQLTLNGRRFQGVSLGD